MFLNVVNHLTESDYKVMQDYLDALAEKCETERYVIWDHPEYSPRFQEAEE